jgi:hypothetical protein
MNVNGLVHAMNDPKPLKYLSSVQASCTAFWPDPRQIGQLEEKAGAVLGGGPIEEGIGKSQID